MRHILINDSSQTPPPLPKPKKLQASSHFLLKALENKKISKQNFLALCQEDEKLQDLALTQESLDFLCLFGLDLNHSSDMLFLNSLHTPLEEQKFCFVDIETTGSNPQESELLEIGAILYQGGKVLKRFESYALVKSIPPIIEEITGITFEDIKDAPTAKEVLSQFRETLGNSIFVAHNANFDYVFLDFLFQKLFGIGIYNQRLCTINLAKRLIYAPRYGLDFLNQFLEIGTPAIHRAYADANTCLQVFKHCLNSIPRTIHTSQDLINFSKHGKPTFKSPSSAMDLTLCEEV